MSRKQGFEQALEMLSGLDEKSRTRILEDIAQKDPDMAEALKENLIRFEDLALLSTKMFQELLREIKIEDLALALRLGSRELKNKLLSQLSTNLRRDVEAILLGPLRPVDEAQEAMNKVMEVVRTKADRGELIFKSEKDDQLV